jgi:hypothetical protein
LIILERQPGLMKAITTISFCKNKQKLHNNNQSGPGQFWDEKQLNYEEIEDIISLSEINTPAKVL